MIKHKFLVGLISTGFLIMGVKFIIAGYFPFAVMSLFCGGFCGVALLEEISDEQEEKRLLKRELEKEKQLELENAKKEEMEKELAISRLEEISKLKQNYISLLELVDKYKRLENIKEIETSELPTINFDDISNTSRYKK